MGAGLSRDHRACRVATPGKPTEIIAQLLAHRGRLVVVDKIATTISRRVSSTSGSQPDAAMIASGWLRGREQYPFVAMRKKRVHSDTKETCPPIDGTSPLRPRAAPTMC